MLSSPPFFDAPHFCFLIAKAAVFPLRSPPFLGEWDPLVADVFVFFMGRVFLFAVPSDTCLPSWSVSPPSPLYRWSVQLDRTLLITLFSLGASIFFPDRVLFSSSTGAGFRRAALRAFSFSWTALKLSCFLWHLPRFLSKSRITGCASYALIPGHFSYYPLLLWSIRLNSFSRH